MTPKLAREETGRRREQLGSLIICSNDFLIKQELPVAPAAFGLRRRKLKPEIQRPLGAELRRLLPVVVRSLHPPLSAT